jgi:predicted metal-binding membrane protein
VTPGPAAARRPARAAPPPEAWLLLALLAGAWLTLAWWGASPYARYLGHSATADGALGELGVIALFMAGWALMVTAMMLPTAGTLLRDFSRVVHRRPRHAGLSALVVAGFVGAWMVVGYAFRVLDLGVHAVVAGVDWLAAHPSTIGGATLVAAGAYEFTDLKRRCLTACRAPRSFIYRHWTGARPAADAIRVGFAYGTSCAGCCWALMLVLFGLGTTSLAWMLAFAAVMALEKQGIGGERLPRVTGTALIASGVVLAAVG